MIRYNQEGQSEGLKCVDFTTSPSTQTGQHVEKLWRLKGAQLEDSSRRIPASRLEFFHGEDQGCYPVFKARPGEGISPDTDNTWYWY